MSHKGLSPYLVWIDCEMTGLDSTCDTIIEIAAIVTTNDLQFVDAGVSVVIHEELFILENMTPYVKKMHTESGLIADVLQSTTTVKEAQEYVLRYIRSWCKPQESPLCGNSIWQDRLFLRKYMPDLESFFHYRIIDVSTIKELVHRWYPDRKDSLVVKSESHRAITDIRESVMELQLYKSRFFGCLP